MQKANTLESHKPPCKQSELKTVEDMQVDVMRVALVLFWLSKENSETPIITNRERLGPWTTRGHSPPINTNSRHQ